MNYQFLKENSSPFSYFKFSEHVLSVGYVVFVVLNCYAVIESLVKTLLLY